MNRLIQKEQRAIAFIRKAEQLSLQMNESGFHVAFSGGKDSQVLLSLVESSGCRYTAHMQVTSVDPPNLMHFVRKEYPQVKLHLPKLNMRQLIVKHKMLPTRQVRFCCAELKEQAGTGTCTCIGVRAAESTNRAKRNPIEIIGQKGIAFEINQDNNLVKADSRQSDLFSVQSESQIFCVRGKDKVVLSPIFDWTTSEVWQYLKGNKIPYCDLYDQGFHRIGCLFCPMASTKEKRHELQMFPGMADKTYIRAIREVMETTGNYGQFDSPEQVFAWWISGKNTIQWLQEQKLSKLF